LCRSLLRRQILYTKVRGVPKGAVRKDAEAGAAMATGLEFVRRDGFVKRRFPVLIAHLSVQKFRQFFESIF
jgi:hypothetical protein